VDPAADHDVFQLPCLNKMPDLALGDTDPRRKLLGGFEALGHGQVSPGGFEVIVRRGGAPRGLLQDSNSGRDYRNRAATAAYTAPAIGSPPPATAEWHHQPPPI
jgi:hypothetical protein